MALIEVDKERIAFFCRAHYITKLSFFGTALTGYFGPDSDVDVLVEFDSEHIPTSFDVAGMEAELSEILGRKANMRTLQDLDAEMEAELSEILGRKANICTLQKLSRCFREEIECYAQAVYTFCLDEDSTPNTGRAEFVEPAASAESADRNSAPDMLLKVRVVRRLVRILVFPIGLALRLTFKASKFLPFIGPKTRFIDEMLALGRLDAGDDVEKARHVRHSAMLRIPFSKAAPLWGMEGRDRLYGRDDPEGALCAFKNAMSTMYKSGICGFFLTDIVGVYAGAASAALMLGDKEAAREYYREFVKTILPGLDQHERFQRRWPRPDLQRDYQRYYHMLSWIRARIGIIADSCSKTNGAPVKTEGNE